MSEEQKKLSEAELKVQLDKAMKAGDMKEVISLARQLDQLEKAKEQAEKEAKVKALEKITDTVKVTIQKALQPLIDSKQLDSADGIWFTQDFGDKLVTCRLTKTAPRKSGGGGGVAKKFDVSTDDLLEKFGDQKYKDTGMTIKEAYDSDPDKNKRYQIRQTLLKLGNYIK